MTFATEPSKNKTIAKKTLREGLAIYKTGRSDNWLISLRDPYSKTYVTRSSGERSRVKACSIQATLISS